MFGCNVIADAFVALLAKFSRGVRSLPIIDTFGLGICGLAVPSVPVEDQIFFPVLVWHSTAKSVDSKLITAPQMRPILHCALAYSTAVWRY